MSSPVTVRRAADGLPAGALLLHPGGDDATEATVAARVARAGREHLAGEPEEFRFTLSTGELRLTSAEVHHDSHQITAAVDAPWLLSLFPESPSAVVDADGRFRLAAEGVDVVVIPAGAVALIPAGRWHGGAIALGDTGCVTTLTRGALHERSSVADLTEPVALDLPRQS